MNHPPPAVVYRTSVNVRLTADEKAALDTLCARWGQSQATTIMRAVREALARTDPEHRAANFDKLDRPDLAAKARRRRASRKEEGK